MKEQKSTFYFINYKFFCQSCNGLKPLTIRHVDSTPKVFQLTPKVFQQTPKVFQQTPKVFQLEAIKNP
jgi:hypothetical protein